MEKTAKVIKKMTKSKTDLLSELNESLENLVSHGIIHANIKSSIWNTVSSLAVVNKKPAKKAKQPAEEVTSKFVTADGVPIVKDMVVYIGPGKGMKSFIVHSERVAEITPEGPKSAYPGSIFRNGIIIPEIVYSTSSAAKKASGNT